MVFPSNFIRRCLKFLWKCFSWWDYKLLRIRKYAKYLGLATIAIDRNLPIRYNSVWAFPTPDWLTQCMLTFCHGNFPKIVWDLLAGPQHWTGGEGVKKLDLSMDNNFAVFSKNGPKHYVKDFSKGGSKIIHNNHVCQLINMWLDFWTTMIGIIVLRSLTKTSCICRIKILLV